MCRLVALVKSHRGSPDFLIFLTNIIGNLSDSRIPMSRKGVLNGSARKIIRY